MEIRGSHDRLRAATGWQPEIPLEQTLRDTLASFLVGQAVERRAELLGEHAGAVDLARR